MDLLNDILLAGRTAMQLLILNLILLYETGSSLHLIIYWTITEPVIQGCTLHK